MCCTQSIISSHPYLTSPHLSFVLSLYPKNETKLAFPNVLLSCYFPLVSNLPSFFFFHVFLRPFSSSSFYFFLFFSVWVDPGATAPPSPTGLIFPCYFFFFFCVWSCRPGEEKKKKEEDIKTYYLATNLSYNVLLLCNRLVWLLYVGNLLYLIWFLFCFVFLLLP